MTGTRIKISSVIQNQLPEFVKEEFPLVVEFLNQYYLSLESEGLPYNLIQNIDKYVKVDNLTNLTDSTVLTSNVSYFDSTINVQSTSGFPDSYGIILIDSEIITYTSKTNTSFTGCVRGFSGITSLENPLNSDELVFSTSSSEQHTSGSKVNNLSILFLQQFFKKVKSQISPGFEDRDFYSGLNESIFVKQSKDFYSSKGTTESFKILFKALYGENVEVIRPQDFLIQPSDAEYRITKDLVVEKLEGDIEDLVNRTIYQDQNDFLDRASGTVTKVEKIIRDSKEYYTLSLDYGYQRDIDVDGTIFGEFTIHPRSKVITSIVDLDPSISGFTTSSTSIDVDSTAGFPNSGNLIVDLPNNTSLTISYEDKTLTQFLGCSGITQEINSGTEIRSDAYAYGQGESGQIKFLVTGVLSDLKLENSQYQNINYPVKIKTLGEDSKDYKANNWFFNIAVEYDLQSHSLIDSSSAPTYSLVFYDDHSFVIGDRVVIKSSIGTQTDAVVVAYNNTKSISIRGNISFSSSFSYRIQKILSRVNSKNYPELSKFTSNVQNVYIDSDNSLFVTAPSLPTYLDQELDIRDKSKTFSGSFSGEELTIGNHSFYTGDAVYYRSSGQENTLGISDGYYFIKKINDTTIKLSKSRPNISNNKFVTFDGFANNDKIELANFVDEVTLESKKIEPQKIIRKLSNLIVNGDKEVTEPGSTGVLVNGVEILNYKSPDSIFYGPIEKINVISSGDNYDVINPPVLEITDEVGTGVTAYCAVTGSLRKINIIDGGFDYLNDPKIIVSGGGGSEASARVNLISFDHEVYFNSESSSSLVDLSSNTITFPEYHKFRDNELVIYDPEGQTSVGGLSTNSQYFVSVQNGYTIKLHKNLDDSVSGINTISLTSFGIGNHKFQSTNKKKKIGSILIPNGGNGYSNKKRVSKSTGINTASNTIEIFDHGYSDGDILVYSFTENPIVGLATTSTYYVSVVDENKFKLSNVGVGTQEKDFFKKTNQFINFESVGSGLHIFNYEPITVRASGVIGVSTLSDQDFNAVLQPIFRGEIDSVFVQDGGSSYGSEEILNYVRQPNFILRSGSGAQLTPVINNGKIENVIVNYSGSYYNSPPDLVINGPGFGAVLTPILSNGTIASVVIVSSGSGYVEGKTTIDVIPSGSSANLSAQIKSWNVNLVERFIQSNQITEDDGIATVGLHKFGLQYSHLYAPRKFRTSVLGTRFDNGETIYEPDLTLLNGRETDSRSHSPIIGWAYDGNPIYGPYGYTSISGGRVRQMISGYQILPQQNRPNSTIYPLGFFVEDYTFINGGDLDENNGRFCVTPEYPNGTYAYFSTVSELVETSGSFKNYKKPVFPYFIGNTYKSKPIDYNFSTNSNQIDFDINKTGWLRNTSPYNLMNSNSGYAYITNPNDIRNQYSIAKSISSGQITSVGILTGGENYQVGDSIEFSARSLDSIPPKAFVSFVEGKSVTSISATTSIVTNVEFYKFRDDQKYTAISTSPHYFNNLDFVNFNANQEYNNYSQVNIATNVLRLTSGVGSTTSTGSVTYFNVSGNLSDTAIQENDIYRISNELVKVLNVDVVSSRIRVLRNTNEFVGVTSYSAGEVLTEVPRRMSLNFNIINDYNLNSRNRQQYFDPQNTVGLGTTSGVGITSTIVFSNPGVGITQVTIPTRSLYIPNHNLENGDELVYSSNGGSSISISTDGISSFQLSDNSILYATKISNDIIGLSTFRVGLSSIGSYIGLGTTSASLLYFTGVGLGNTHSLETNYPNILVGEISKNIVTVSTASSHGLFLNNSVILDITSGLTTSLNVKYNDYSRRTIINERSFGSSDVDIVKNTISIENHGFTTGQKVIHTSTVPCGGLIDEKIYYVIVVDRNTIQLSNTQYYSTRKERDVANITSSSIGNILPINPPIKLVKGEGLQIQVSDPSLSFIKNSILYSAFDLNFYTDSDFKNKFDFSQSDFVEVVRSGKVGIDTTATVTLRTTNTTPNILYYKLDPINTNLSLDTKKESIVDKEVIGFGQISILESVYSGQKKVIGISTNTFNFLSENTPEVSSYNSESSDISYITNSNNVYGPINSIKIKNSGRNLKELPSISKIQTGIGTKALLDLESKNIGSILNYQIQDIGFEYPSDLTIRPTAKATEILKIKTQSSFNSIGISSVGKGYSLSPNLIVLDGLTGNIVNDVDLRYTLGSTNVEILKNTKGINNVTPTIIPINNTNGVRISSLDFNSSSKEVIVTLGSSFSNVSDFPFEIGDKVLIENVSVGVGSTGTGYNSENYNYALFTLTNTTPNIGGIGATVAYSLTEYLKNGEIPGTFNNENSSARIIPQKHFPIFNIDLEKNEFYVGEEVYSNESLSEGKVIDWDPSSEYLKISTSDQFTEGQTIIGKSSSSRGMISSLIETKGSYTVSSSSIVKKGWEKETGILDNQFQRIHDNDYYQYFSYALKSQVPFDTWGDAVGNLNHTAGFKKFSDLIVESSVTTSGITTSQDSGDFTGIADLSRSIDLNCVYDFDLVKENNFSIDGKIKSNEIVFNSRIIQDYIESIGNRVLLIDDVSDQFNSNPRPTQFSIVDTFGLDSRSIKFLTFVRDRRFSEQKQVSLVTLVHDGSNGYINQYGAVDTYGNMGFFDFSIAGDEGNLLFYPTRSLINDYNISCVSFDIRDTISSIGSTDLGSTVFVGSSTTTISSGSSSPITVVGIASTYRSSKVIVQIGATDSSYYEFDEITLIHDGTDIILQEYGQLASGSLVTYSESGIGTYNAYYSGSNINIDLIPNNTTTVSYNINSIRVSIANSSSTSTGVESFNNSVLQSNYVAISSTPSPGITTIATYSSAYSGSYFIVSVEDLTNNQYQVSEVVVAHDDVDPHITEFGIINTNSSIGLIDINFVPSTGSVDLTFTPNPDIDVEVRVYQNSIGLVNDAIPYREIDFTNAFIRTGYGDYEASQSNVRRSFQLTYNQNPIFERYFDGSSSSIVDIDNDVIIIPEHFFVTGEKVAYTIAGAGSTQAIGIATTTISGVGVTDKLPSTLYIVKSNELGVQVAASASDALKLPPNILDITSVGIGTSHRFVSTNQNSRVLIGIDNLIQSPIVSTAITTTLAEEVRITDERLTFSGITSFFGGDLIKIDDEIMRINSVGLGSTNVILVQRFWMGTGIASHAQNSLITKVRGDYNIIDNTINFVEAPYGLTPIGSTSNPPDSRDFVGIETHSTFHGRSFIRSGLSNDVNDSYAFNYVFDDISRDFNGITTSFSIKSEGSNISGISTSNAIVLINDIFQGPERFGSVDILGDYYLTESAGETQISFTGTASSASYDINTAIIPRGGIIVSVASTGGFGYQPLVAAGGTAVISGLGTIQSISIGNSGSGYRPGVQSVVNVGVATSSVGNYSIEFIGTASISGGHIVSVAITNPGVGYTSTNPPIVIFDDPLSYSNIPLIYTSSSSGVGTEAIVDIVVGQGSSVISFNSKNSGYGYGQSEKLTVAIGGTTGIPTNTSLPFEQFEVTIDRTFSDEFSGWSIGDLQVIDPFDSLFDGERTTFPIRINGNQTTMRSKKGSNIEVKSNLLIFINDILQVPDISYIFEGGSIITFVEPPKVGDKSKVLFYKGTGNVDTVNVDILETIKEGDTVKINSDFVGLNQDSRLVTDIISTDILETNTYSGPGITEDETLLRPLIWCRQTEDKIINGQEVGKDRILYEPLITPTSNLIENVSISSTQIWVESVKTFFDSYDEYLHDGTSEIPQNKITIISQNDLVAASATAVVSAAGTISSIIISNGGIGYTSTNPPEIVIENPVGLGSTQRASVLSVVSSAGTVSNIVVSSPGTGYTTSNPPVVLIEPPAVTKETIDSVSYIGDFGTIVGYGISTISGSDKNIFDLYIPQDSFLRDTDVVGTAITVSQIQVGDFFVVQNSNVGAASTNFFTYRTNGSIIGLSTQYVDGIYQVDTIETHYKNVVGVGTTVIKRVFAVVEPTTGISTIGMGSSTIFFDSTYYTWDYLGITTYSGGSITTSNYIGEFSWGRIYDLSRNEPKEFKSYGFSGINTSASVIRFNPLKYKNYVN